VPYCQASGRGQAPPSSSPLWKEQRLRARRRRASRRGTSAGDRVASLRQDVFLDHGIEIWDRRSWVVRDIEVTSFNVSRFPWCWTLMLRAISHYDAINNKKSFIFLAAWDDKVQLSRESATCNAIAIILLHSTICSDSTITIVYYYHSTITMK
jgi:hypothetical protein